MITRRMPDTAQALHTDALEGQLALRVAGHLHRAADALPHDIGQRLRFARDLAVQRATAVHKASAATALLALGHGETALTGPPSWWLRLASTLPLLVLVGGLVLIQRHHTLEQIRVAAEIDTALLADELPPAAYSDPGFSEFLHDAATP